MWKNVFVWYLCVMSLWITGPAVGQSAEREGAAITPESGLLLTRSADAEGGPRHRPRSFGGSDVVRARLVDGTLAQYRPMEGQVPEGQEGWEWQAAEFDEKGGVKERGRYLYVPVESDEQKAMVLHASGHTEAYVNGAPRGGDVYNAGYVHLPVLLDEGANHLLFQAGRGRFKVRLYEPPAPVFVLASDMTCPDLVAGRTADTWGGVIVVNATTEPTEDLTLAFEAAGLTGVATPVPTIPPLSIRKVGFRIRSALPVARDAVEGTLELRRAGRSTHSLPLKLAVVRVDQRRKVTFISDIDGSVQYYSVRPALSTGDPAPALVLSCHGAGVEAHGQTGAYASHDWFHIVAPTNRRPFGYDWEDFGRMDAMEVLALAQDALRHDPSRIYLTGHSMGGHGAWHLGVTYPDRFAATGPSAGWLSRSTYGRRRGGDEEPSPLEELLRRCRKSGDTVALSANLKQLAVYILHGGDDDNVPAAQAQQMAEVLEEFHHDWMYREEPGQGHWWGNEYNDGGSACVDWPFMFDWFARHALPPTGTVRDVEFVTANPGVSSRCHWLAIEGQIRHLDLSKAHVHVWPNQRRFKGTTENVAVLRLDVGHLRTREPITVELDEQKLADIPYPAKTGSLWLGQQDGQWRCIDKPSLRHKGPHRYGAIKDELKHRVLFVFGTHGTAEENAWAFNKARYDAETFWYRGNAAVDILRDSDFAAARYPDRTVVLYGNAETNSAWPALLSDSPVQVRAGQVRVGRRTLDGADLSAIFVQPRNDSDVASVVAVSGSGPVGMRSTYPVSFFRSFVRYPDCQIARVSADDAGASENVAAGFFGLDWSVKNGEFVFADESASATP